MNRRRQFLRLLVAFALASHFSARAQTSTSSQANERIRTAENFAKTRLYARTMTGEDPGFRRAIDALDAKSDRIISGVWLVPAAVAAQTQVRQETLAAQQAETGLSYGELLVANSLAVGSGHSFARILAMRASTLTWAELSLKLHINPNSIVARAQEASRSVNNSQARFQRRRRESIYGLDVLRTRNSQDMPRQFGRGLYSPGG